MRELKAFEPLVKLLSSPYAALQLTATTCLLNCSLEKENQILLKKLGGLKKLLDLLNSPHHQIQINALVTICNYCLERMQNFNFVLKIKDTLINLFLSKQENNQREIRELNGLAILFSLLTTSPFEIVQEKVAAVLINCLLDGNLLISNYF